MAKASPKNTAMLTLEADQLQDLLQALKDAGHTLIGPTCQEEAIVYDHIDGVGDLPQGWTDEQEAGHYRLKRREDDAYFGYVVGPRSWKQFLFPPQQTLWQAKRNGNGFEVNVPDPVPEKMAFIGVRSCELHAMFIQDRVFIRDIYQDPVYLARREAAFVVAVQCTLARSTCFCTSMNTGPKAKEGFDLALTEVLEPERHYFVVEVGSDRGQEIMDALTFKDASSAETDAAQAQQQQAVAQMGRSMETAGIKELLYRNYDHPRWDAVAERCLSCANCTMVCPTCFCSNVEDVTDLSGESAERVRSWDSCFTMDFSYIHGGSVRPTTKSRYRQWMTHKLATWIDQFDSSGCVGCGRCITWCPVGIDITEEVLAIQQSEGGAEDDDPKKL